MADFQQIKAVIFDFDGTLVGSTIDFDRMHQRLSCLARDLGVKLPGRHLPALEMMQELTTDRRQTKVIRFRRLARKLIEEEEILGTARAAPIAGSPELLKKLKQAGFIIGIITRNCRRAVLPLLEKFGFSYDLLLTRDDVARVKPHPDHLRQALRKLNVRPEQSLVVGDHPFELQAGRQLGVTCIGVMTGSKKSWPSLREKADFLFRDVGQLRFLLDLEPFPAGKLPVEFLEGLLRRYPAANENVLVGPGIGQDCAIVRHRSSLLVLGSDPITLVSEEAGRYLVAVNANDLAVSGARPEWLLTTLLFPEKTKFSEVETIFQQIFQECHREKISWVGGHTEFSRAVNSLIASGNMGGRLVSVRPPARVQPGDCLVLVKPAGIEAASVIVRLKGSQLVRKIPQRILFEARNSLKIPGISVVKEALWLWENFPVKMMHDPTEGGVATGIRELAQRCQVGFRIQSRERKVYHKTQLLARCSGLPPLGYISSGFLLVIFPPCAAPVAIEKAWQRKIDAWLIGQATRAEEGLILEGPAGERELPYFSQDEITRLP
ncbi:MAG: HAD-IA family hydrolase [Candidatus Omnitrophica bacterium]|nr:HAD-IA family hydrolase [Candidatus Omnitrophota bacterium]